MIHLSRRYAIFGLTVLIAVLVGGAVLAATQKPSASSNEPSRSAAQPTGTVIQITGQPAGVGTTETTEEGLTITFVQMVKHGTRWLFHFQIKNTTQKAAIIRGTDDVHQFVVSGNTQVAPPNNIGVAQLGTPAASEIAVNHPEVASTLQPGGTTQGWLAVDTMKLDFMPTQLLYRYKAVPTLGCADPADSSTCHIDTLYQALIWGLP